MYVREREKKDGKVWLCVCEREREVMHVRDGERLCVLEKKRYVVYVNVCVCVYKQ